ncbi:MAG TPA: hypothetical protein VK890_02080, partial [Bacteroidia bacterium]|nr:hypothetical protein [Bacteroidia bacterium]
MNIKKSILPFCLLAFTVRATAQTIPNKGFEDWTYYKGSGYEVPAHWITNDVLTAKFNHKYKGTSTHKSSEAHTGNYAVKMEVVTDHGETVNGCIYSTGNIDSLIFFYQSRSNAGFKVNAQPTALTGYYKFINTEGDSAIFGVTLTKWNKEKKQR